MLVNRWGILRKPLSANYTIQKVVSLVNCLCRLQNFLIDAGISEEGVIHPTENDEWEMRMSGAVIMTKKR